ncbi:MAG: hypothetical protein NWT08_09805 [Akkermansiaceae bacterium]|jgi:hypothetical protein|nr:hypothetical protein [Akkermansiaceae bacterium]MDP4645946.1 hypothetical protein [Akkermansiaceae bacterium]MDP4722420.1 hypothetical protein [Akkermansiaceae bacterium]MDP4781155.1 hypothetical protein [Akkermansiaceae bacterium]MDP4846503.1 hypothetical protein [Akkermansiaceae bacterium]
MKTLILLLCTASFIYAETITLKLECTEGDTSSYGSQIKAEFAKLLNNNIIVAKEFAEFEATDEEKKRGGFTGEPQVIPVLMSVGEVLDNGVCKTNPRDSKMVALFALHYTYESESRAQMLSKNGFFALFTVTGVITTGEGEKVEKAHFKDKTLTAEFKGFRRATDLPVN